jgi:histidinol-phosphate/aromatic aminotransferase/cobyric acid decarboxylase-like protein
VTRISEYAAIAALEDQDYLKEITRLNGGRMIFHFSMASFVATTYPTRKPANPYALENARISEYAAIAALEDQDYLKEITRKNAKEREKFYIRVTLNGGRMIFHFSMASFVATTYPTRKPANPYAICSDCSIRRSRLFKRDY